MKRIHLLSLVRRLASAIGVGGLATLMDLVALAALVEVAGLDPSAANVPALLVGACVQFVGCRKLIFRRGPQRSARSQLGPFVLVELGTLALNALFYAWLVQLQPFGAPYALLRLVSTFVVFVGFSFPAWHWVFRPPAEPDQRRATRARRSAHT